MPTTYTTKQGETVDLACRAHYGRTAEVTETVLSANPGLAARGPVLPIGTTIVMPDIAKKTTASKLVSLWD
ncbi:tail protein X [Shinella sp. BE166]|uniref:tail protein X n=1 Tax=unclassified Shinella TaxID=2643062 RepID=UPI003EBECD31